MNTKNALRAEPEFPSESTASDSQSSPGIPVSRGIPVSKGISASGNYTIPRVLWTTEDIARKVQESKVVVFAKGTRDCPRCGFSEELMSAVEAFGMPYQVVDVSQERSIVPALKAYAGSNYLPLVFVNGKLASTWQTQSDVLQSGELRSQIERAFTK